MENKDLPKLDLNKPILNTEELRTLASTYLPKMMQPKVWSGLEGLDLVSYYRIKQYMDPGEKYITLSTSKVSCIIDLGAMADLAAEVTGIGNIFGDEPNKNHFVIFVRESMPSAATLFFVTVDMFRIMLTETKGFEYARTGACFKESVKKARECLREIFPENIDEILSISNTTLVKFKEE